MYFCRVLSETGDQSLTIFIYYTIVHLLYCPMVERLHAVVSLCNQIENLFILKALKSMLWSRQKCYDYANKLHKIHKILVCRLKPRPFLSTPTFQLQPDGSPTYCPRTVSKVFYHKLYNCLNSDPQFHFTHRTFYTFFVSLHLPKVSPANLFKLNMTITANGLMAS